MEILRGEPPSVIEIPGELFADERVSGHRAIRRRRPIASAQRALRARLNLIRHLLDSIPYKKVDVELPKIPKAQRRPKDATEGLSAGLLIPGRY